MDSERRLTPTQRLEAFLEHNQLLVTLHQASRAAERTRKCFAGGPRDVADARSAYQAAQGPVNLDLLRTATRRFGRDAADKLEEILAP
ncbi:MAG TPA: hypothetical protein VGL87_01125 [Steroidobacteraceae bacterium]